MSKRVNNKKGNRAVRSRTAKHATKVRARSKPYQGGGMRSVTPYPTLPGGGLWPDLGKFLPNSKMSSAKHDRMYQDAMHHSGLMSEHGPDVVNVGTHGVTVIDLKTADRFSP